MHGSDGNRARWAAAEYGDRLHNDLRHGAIAGLLGGVSIILLFSAYDALFFGPLTTPDRLSQSLLSIEDVAAGIGVRLSFVVRIGLFTVFHLGSFAVLGTVLANLFRMSGVRSRLLLGGLYGLTACTVVFFAGLNLSGTQLLAAPEWPALLLGNFVAGVVMGGYLQVRASL